ncbi:hypothetical protein MWH28_01410 [Natroniella sulfidigena]|uniref:hypothetical protein n=1 Tax=Natroniella sulfidigena TaxID=723921 RepID=UPI00200B8E46|nr:hypothetical protein [Natroniella sulfidigena]MCK8816021.1 hypothetical protein [Natroniella sulfidigena]
MIKLIKQLKEQLLKVKHRKKRLAELEMKLRSMRRLAVYIRDEELTVEEKVEVKQEFDRLKLDIRNKE